MGLLDFVKDAGAKLTGRETADERAEAEALEELRKGNSLVRHVFALGLEIEEPKIAFDDGIATIRGTCPSQQEREKVILAVGNVAGVSQVDDRILVEAPEPEASFYTVVGGDTLSKIAKEQYGDAMKYPVIFEANKPMLTDPDKIYVGQVLRIPPLG
ncbi:MAG: peptidoglycan-binding protein LysM [Gemmatimonadetes bacterium]|nr:peptidoglycan-binding protein LysM [Gemmatimonadota bacterium]NNM05410.1 peptidoglycan-binding protein LysM [Gemmatimonadota bacterium]